MDRRTDPAPVAEVVEEEHAPAHGCGVIEHVVGRDHIDEIHAGEPVGGPPRPLEPGMGGCRADRDDDVVGVMRGDDVAVAVPLRGQDPPELDLAGEWRSVLDDALPVRLLERVQ